MQQLMQLPHVSTASGTDSEAHLFVARDWIRGMEVLFAATPIAVRAFCHLSGQAIESLLAAFILTRADGKDRHVVEGHDLLTLWRTASDLGLRQERPPPAWLIQLARGRKTSYGTRHQSGKASSSPARRAQAIDYPNATELRTEVLRLEARVALHVQAHQDADR